MDCHKTLSSQAELYLKKKNQMGGKLWNKDTQKLRCGKQNLSRKGRSSVDFILQDWKNCQTNKAQQFLSMLSNNFLNFTKFGDSLLLCFSKWFDNFGLQLWSTLLDKFDFVCHVWLCFSTLLDKFDIYNKSTLTSFDDVLFKVVQ